MKHFLLAWHRRIWIWILTGIPVLTGLATFYYALNRVDQYRSIAEILVTPEHLPGTPVLQGQNVTGENLASHTEAMKTKLICTMAAYKLLLHDMEERVPFRDFAPLSTELGSGLITAKLKSHLASFETLSSRDSITNEINYAMEMKGYNLAKWIANGNLSISPVKDSEIIRVESVSENPFLSAFVVNSLCTEYIRYKNFIRSNGASDSLHLLEDQLKKRQEELALSKRMRQEYKPAMTVVSNTTRQGRGEQLTRLRKELRSAEIEANGKAVIVHNLKLRLAQMKKPPTNQDHQRTKLKELGNKIDELQNIYTQGGATDQELATTIHALREQLKKIEQTYQKEWEETTRIVATYQDLLSQTNKAEADYRTADELVKSIRSAIYRLQSQSLSPVQAIAPDDNAAKASLDSLYRHAQKAYDQALEKVKIAKAAWMLPASKGNRVELIVRGQPHAEPEDPGILKLVVAAIALSGVFCAGIILITHKHTDRRPVYPRPRLTIVR